MEKEVSLGLRQQAQLSQWIAKSGAKKKTKACYKLLRQTEAMLAAASQTNLHPGQSLGWAAGCEEGRSNTYAKSWPGCSWRTLTSQCPESSTARGLAPAKA